MGVLLAQAVRPGAPPVTLVPRCGADRSGGQWPVAGRWPPGELLGPSGHRPVLRCLGWAPPVPGPVSGAANRWTPMVRGWSTGEVLQRRLPDSSIARSTGQWKPRLVDPRSLPTNRP